MCSKDMTGHAIIGEAAVSLAMREKEITVSALIIELDAMLRVENLSVRRQSISHAVEWLGDFRSIGVRPDTAGAERSWMMPDMPHSGSEEESVIRLQADDKDMK
ncbi:hypothetical protein [Pantoea rodasii]|nr:hypothetical protein [Pantoea rodasii]